VEFNGSRAACDASALSRAMDPMMDPDMAQADGLMRASASSGALSPLRRKAPSVGTKGLYELTSGAALLYSEPDASGTPLCAIRGGVRFHGIPYKFGVSEVTAKKWVMVHTDDVPPPMLCFGKEAGQAERGRAHIPKEGIAAMSYLLGNGAIPRPLKDILIRQPDGTFEKDGTFDKEGVFSFDIRKAIPRAIRHLRDVQFVDTDKQFRSAGSITSVTFFVGYPSIQHDLRFQIFRRTRDDIFRMVGETPGIPCPEGGVQTYVLPVPLAVARNDFMGWSHLGSGMIAGEEGGNLVKWNIGRQGKDVNINMKNSRRFTFSYDVTYQNHCLGHMLYKASAPAPLFSNPEVSEADATLWCQLDEKCIVRVRDIVREARGVDDDDIVAAKLLKKRSQASLPPISPEFSKMSSNKMSLTQSMKALDSDAATWLTKGKGCWINYRRFGPVNAPPNDNCGRWRQLNSMGSLGMP